MNIVFIGSLCPPKLKKEIFDKHFSFDAAANALQSSLLKGLSNHVIKIFSIPTLSPKDKFFVRTEKFSTDCISDNLSLPYINIPGIKQILLPVYSTKFLDVIDCHVDVVFLYVIQSHTLKLAEKLKKNNPGCKVIVMVPDLAEFMTDNTNYLYLTLKKIEAKIVNRHIDVVDAYILLSEYMTERLPIGEKPYCVIEGIYDNIINTDSKIKDVNNIKQVLYTGTLSKRFGIKNLIEAFKTLKNENYRLLICGKGDGEEDVLKAVEEDKRIVFLGQLPREEVLKLQSKVDLLINPRGPEGVYTKYSFPSKTLEYLASGTPTLLCQLPAIPQEYYKHCYSIKDNDKESLSSAMKIILEKDSSELKSFGKQARKFILENKNAQVQGEKIIKFIKSIK